MQDHLGTTRDCGGESSSWWLDTIKDMGGTLGGEVAGGHGSTAKVTTHKKMGGGSMQGYGAAMDTFQQCTKYDYSVSRQRL